MLNHTKELQEKQSQGGSAQPWKWQVLTLQALNLTALEWPRQVRLKLRQFQFRKFSEQQAGHRQGPLTGFMISLLWQRAPLPL